MDFCQEFNSIDSVLSLFQRRSGSLLNQVDKKVAFELTEALKTNLIGKAIDETLGRRITIYLILQTDLAISQELENDLDFGHLVNSQMNGALLVQIIWGLGLQSYFFETIEFCPHALGDELTNLAISASLNVNDCIFVAGQLASRVFNKIRHIEQAEDVEQNLKGIIVNRFFHHFITVLQSLVVHESNSASLSDEENSANRCRLLCILKLTSSCFSQSEDIKTPAAEYQMKVDYDYSVWKKECDISLSDLQRKIIEDCTMCVKNMNISTILWCDWLEINSDIEGKSFQTFIGEEMYNCMLALKQSGSSEASELISILKMMAIKPETEDDLIQIADFKTILKNLFDTNKTHSKWLAALLKFDTDEVSFEECLVSIEKCIPIQFELIDDLVDFVVRCLNSGMPSVNGQRLKILALKALTSLEQSEQVKAMQSYFEKYGITSMLMTADCSQAFTEVFNKAVSVNETKKEEQLFAELINLCFQSPEILLMKMLTEGMSNANQTLLMLKAFNILQPICQLSGLGTDATNKDTGLLIKLIIKFVSQMELRDHEEINFVNLITSLVRDCVIDRDTLLEYCIIPTLRQCLLAQQWNIAVLCLKIIKITSQDIDLKRIVLLVVMLSQVMHLSRCELLDFTSSKYLVCEETCIIMKSLVSRLLNAGDLLDKRYIQWIERKTCKLETINMSYFLKLRTGCPTHVSAETLIMSGIPGGRINDGTIAIARDRVTKEDLLPQLVKNLPKLSAREWKSLSCLKPVVADSEDDDGAVNLFHLLVEALMIINCIVKSQFNENKHALPCISLCIRNFALFVQDEILKYPSSDASEKSKHSNNLPVADLKIVFEKLLLLLESLPDAIKEPCSIALMAFMKRIQCDVMSLESAGKVRCPEETILQMCALISLSSVRDVRVGLARDIADMTC